MECEFCMRVCCRSEDIRGYISTVIGPNYSHISLMLKNSEEIILVEARYSIVIGHLSAGNSMLTISYVYSLDRMTSLLQQVVRMKVHLKS